jgi:hypothetical protein
LCHRARARVYLERYLTLQINNLFIQQRYSMGDGIVFSRVLRASARGPGTLSLARAFSPPTHPPTLTEKGRHRRANATAPSSVLFPERKQGTCPPPHLTVNPTLQPHITVQKRGDQAFPPLPVLFPEREPFLSPQPSDVLWEARDMCGTPHMHGVGTPHPARPHTSTTKAPCLCFLPTPAPD